MPPTHCVSARQKRMLFGMVSKPEKTVMPVVVKPLIASKYASRPLALITITNGNAPKADTTSQPIAQINMEPTVSSVSGLNRVRSKNPTTNEAKAVALKAVADVQPSPLCPQYAKTTINGTRRTRLSISSTPR